MCFLLGKTAVSCFFHLYRGNENQKPVPLVLSIYVTNKSYGLRLPHIIRDCAIEILIGS